MPNPADIQSEELDPDDPDDQLRMELDQGQGNNLAGGPQPPGQTGMAPPGAGGMPQPVAPSPNVPGPLSALAGKGKPRIKLKAPPPGVKPHIKLKSTSPPPKVKKIKPKIRLKSQPNPSSALQNFLNTIGS